MKNHKYLRLNTNNNKSQGLHLHLSNKYLSMRVDDKDELEGIGIIIIIYFVTLFAYFEPVIRCFLNRDLPNDHLKSYWAKSIYYNRDQYYNNNNNLCAEHVCYIEKSLRLLLFVLLNGNIQSEQNLYFDVFKDLIVPKFGDHCGGGGFAIKIYNKLTDKKQNDKSIAGHLEIRLHHSTDDYAEIHNWILFCNMFLAKCTNDIKSLHKEDGQIDSDKIFKFMDSFSKLQENIKIDPPEYAYFLYQDGTHKDKFINSEQHENIFNILFDDIIKCKTLKTFYRSRTETVVKNLYKKQKISNFINRFAGIDNHNFDYDIPIDFNLHSEKTFSNYGMLKNLSNLTRLMQNIPLEEYFNQEEYDEYLNYIKNLYLGIHEKKQDEDKIMSLLVGGNNYKKYTKEKYETKYKKYLKMYKAEKIKN